MSPYINDQGFIVCIRWPWTDFRKGQIVLVKHPYYQLIVKRIKAIRENQILLMGDHACSTSTESMGWLDRGLIIGRVCWYIPSPQINTGKPC